MLTLAGYFDASGTHQASKTVSVGGYISTPEQWEVFEDEWLEALADFGLEFFHMTDFAVRARPYDRWSDYERSSRFERLVSIINRHVIVSVGTAFDKRVFKTAVSRKAKRFMGGAFGLGAHCAFLSTARYLRPYYPSARVAYIFDHGSEGAGQVLKMFRTNSEDPVSKEELMLLSIRFESKTRFVPLQAADILAYELYQQLPRQHAEHRHPPRVRHLRLLSAVPNDWGKLDKNAMRKFSLVASAAADWHQEIRTRAFR